MFYDKIFGYDFLGYIFNFLRCNYFCVLKVLKCYTKYYNFCRFVIDY